MHLDQALKLQCVVQRQVILVQAVNWHRAHATTDIHPAPTALGQTYSSDAKTVPICTLTAVYFAHQTSLSSRCNFAQQEKGWHGVVYEDVCGGNYNELDTPTVTPFPVARGQQSTSMCSVSAMRCAVSHSTYDSPHPCSKMHTQVHIRHCADITCCNAGLCNFDQLLDCIRLHF